VVDRSPLGGLGDDSDGEGSPTARQIIDAMHRSA
jgi:hypothetical protein